MINSIQCQKKFQEMKILQPICNFWTTLIKVALKIEKKID